MLNDKMTEELATQLQSAGVDEAINKINTSLKKAGLPFRIDTIHFTDEEATKPCRCVERGIVGYEEKCTTTDGHEVCTRVPIYGCKVWDCT